jgi:hypothetical protein
MIKMLSISFLLFISCSVAVAQQTYFSISGTISDTKETLPGAGVYLSGYKMATVTDSNGKFVLRNLSPGTYDVLIQMIGYLPYTKTVVVSDKPVVINITLQENTTILKEVVIKPDPNRAYYIEEFKKYFIGISPNAAQCKILNTYVLVIDDDHQKGLLTMSATDFLIIENQALGYRIKYLLVNFEYDYHNKIVFYAGHSTFEEMKGSKSKQKRWEKNRETAYRGSAQHFYTSLYNNKVEEEGFQLIKRYQILNKNRAPDSLIKANMRTIITGKKSASNGTDTLTMNYWSKENRKPKYLHMLNRSKILTDTLVKQYNNNIKTINFTDELFVIYKNEQETAAYKETSDYQVRPKDLEKYQVSVAKLLQAPIAFSSNGVTVNPRSTLYSGYWSYEKMADCVPIDYVPLAKEK